MDPTLITAVAAAGGSLVGATASIVTTWITQRTQSVQARREETLRRREALYGDFITEASRLTIEAFSHSLERPDTLVTLYGITGRIRLVATDAVLRAAESCVHQIIDLYARPNMTVEQIRVAIEQERLDPIRDFSVACRHELLQIIGGDRYSWTAATPYPSLDKERTGAMSTSQSPHEASRHGSCWAWLLAVGVTMVLLGAFALGATAILNVASALLLGPLLVANSICQILLMMFSGPPRSRFVHLGSAVLSGVVAVLVLAHGSEAGGDLALLLAAFLLAAGLERMVGSRELDLPGRGWLVAAGTLAFALGLCVWAQAPTRGLWLITACVALDFVGHGATWVWFSLLVRGRVESPIPDSELARAPAKRPAQLLH
jgi:uncharacterized membrane protein HdeD (DUF308 family)